MIFLSNKLFSYLISEDFNFIYYGKKEGPEKSMPLIVSAHGGPHATFSNLFDVKATLFALLGSTNFNFYILIIKNYLKNIIIHLNIHM